MFTASFWKTTLEAVLTTGLATFGAAFGVQGAATLKGLEAAGIAAGLAALATFTKQLGAVQSASGTPKVAAPSK